MPQSTSPQQGTAFSRGTSPQRGAELGQSTSPQRVVELKTGKCMVQPGKLSVTASHLLVAVQQGLNAQRVVPHQTPSPLPETKLNQGTHTQYGTYTHRASVQQNSKSLQTELTPCSPMLGTKSVHKGPPQPDANLATDDSLQPKIKRARRTILHPKDESTQTEPIYPVSFPIRTETTRRASIPTQAELMSRALLLPKQIELTQRGLLKPEAETIHRGSFSKLTESIHTGSLPLERAPTCRPSHHPGSESSHRYAVHQATGLTQRRSPPLESESIYRVSLPTQTESTHGGSLYPESRSNYTTSQQPEIKLVHRALNHPESESYYRCALHQATELADRGSLPSEINSTHWVSTPAQTESTQRAPSPTQTEATHRGSLSPEHASKYWGSLPQEIRSAHRPSYHPERESSYRCILHKATEPTHRSSLSAETESSMRSSLCPETAYAGSTLPASKDESSQTEPSSGPLLHSGTGFIQRVLLQPKSESTCRCSVLSQTEFVPKDLSPRALPKFGPDSAWWSLLQPDTRGPKSQVPPCQVFSDAGGQSSATGALRMERDVVADSVCSDTGSSSKDLALPVLDDKLPVAAPLHKDKPECAGPSYEAADMIKLARERTVTGHSSFFVGMFKPPWLDEFTGDFLHAHDRRLKADTKIRRLLKKWLHLLLRASNEVLHICYRQGGTNVPRMGDLCDIAVVTHAFRLLTCPDATVSIIAASALEETARKRIGRQPTGQDLATFLSGSLEGEFSRDGGDFASLWSRARNATRRLGNRIGCAWTWSEERRELGVTLRPAPHADLIAVTPRTRTFLERFLKDAVRNKYAGDLRAKPDQGKVFDVTSKWDASNHFMPGGSFTRFADWRFLHRARLNCLPLNGAVHFGHRDKRCRRCGYVTETLPHVLCSCKPHARA
ncbi:PREDICTED: uncharacterized protein C17orf47 homolog [Gavialis gangeticus]|uniref:uncharacterized protein C17orf47 homolog n=1 Tax=Gavialis gangeticus TaxID=94835 RepID=UPI00092F023D|nr:PREDICTED: uncharacterized protein C17orf47 homolog [Gavialis gangeticus]